MQQPPSEHFFQFPSYIPHSQAGNGHPDAVYHGAQPYAPLARAAPFGAPAGVRYPAQPVTHTTYRSYIPQQNIHVPGATRHLYAPVLAAPLHHGTGTALSTSTHLDPQAPTFTPVRTGPPCPIPIVRPLEAAAPLAARERVESTPPSRPSAASSVTQVEHTPQRDEVGAQRLREDAVRAFADGLVRHVEKQAAFERDVAERKDELERAHAQRAREPELERYLEKEKDSGVRRRDGPPHCAAPRPDVSDTQTNNTNDARCAADDKTSESAPATQPEQLHSGSRKKNKKSRDSPASGANAVPVSARVGQARPVQSDVRDQMAPAPASTAAKAVDGASPNAVDGASPSTPARPAAPALTPAHTPSSGPLATLFTTLSALGSACTARSDGAAHFAAEVQRCMSAAADEAATAAAGTDARALLADVLLATAAAAAGALRALAAARFPAQEEEEEEGVCVDGEDVVPVDEAPGLVEEHERVDGAKMRGGVSVPRAAEKSKGERGKKHEEKGQNKRAEGRKGKKGRAKEHAVPATGGKKKKGKGYKA